MLDFLRLKKSEPGHKQSDFLYENLEKLFKVKEFFLGEGSDSLQGTQLRN